VKLKTSVLAIGACLLWSTAFAGVKIGLEYMSPLELAGIRFMLAGLMLLPFCGTPASVVKHLKGNLKTVLLLSLFQTVLVYTLFYTGMTRVPGATAAIIIGASPLISALMAHIFIHDDPLSWRKLLFITMGLSGVVIISLGKHDGSVVIGDYGGVLLLLLSSISGAGGNVLVAKNRKKIHPLILNSFQIGLGGLALFVMSWFFEGAPAYSGLPVKFWAALVWLSMVSAAGFSIWFMLLQRPGVKVSELNLWKFVIPIFGAVLSWLLLPEESPNLVSIIGMITVSVSIISYSVCTHKKLRAFCPRI